VSDVSEIQYRFWLYYYSLHTHATHMPVYRAGTTELAADYERQRITFINNIVDATIDESAQFPKYAARFG